MPCNIIYAYTILHVVGKYLVVFFIYILHSLILKSSGLVSCNLVFIEH